MFRTFEAAGYTTLGHRDHRLNAGNTYTFAPSLGSIKGAHTLKFGLDARMFRRNTTELRSPRENSASTRVHARTRSAPRTRHGGEQHRVIGPRPAAPVRPAELLRSGCPFAAGGRVAGFSDLRCGLVYVGVDGHGRHPYQWDAKSVSPRLGAAHQLDARTVIRAGYAHIYAAPFKAASGTDTPFGFRGETPWISTIDGVTPTNLLRNLYPNGFTPPRGSADGLKSAIGEGFRQISPTIRCRGRGSGMSPSSGNCQATCCSRQATSVPAVMRSSWSVMRTNSIRSTWGWVRA